MVTDGEIHLGQKLCWWCNTWILREAFADHVRTANHTKVKDKQSKQKETE